MQTTTFTSHDNDRATLTVSARGMFVVLDAEQGGDLFSIELRKPEAYALASYVEWLTERDDFDPDCWEPEDIGTLIHPYESDRAEPSSYEEWPEWVNVESDVYPSTDGGETAVVIIDVTPMENVDPISISLLANDGTERELITALYHAAATAA